MTTSKITAPVLVTSKSGKPCYKVVVDGKPTLFSVEKRKAAGQNAKKVAQAFYEKAVAEAAKPVRRRAKVKAEETTEKVNTTRRAKSLNPKAPKTKKHTVMVAKHLGVVVDDSDQPYRWKALLPERKVSRSSLKFGNDDAFLQVCEEYLNEYDRLEFRSDYEDMLPMAIPALRRSLKIDKSRIVII